jgi:cysteine desulfuration protein SufE
VTLPEKQQSIIDDLSVIENVQERLGVVVDRARARASLAATERTDANRVRGCVSLAWIVGELREGRCHFRSDADSPLVRGLLTLMCDFYTDASPAEVASVEPKLFEELGLTHSLSPTRQNGLRSVREKIRDFAAQALTENA